MYKGQVRFDDVIWLMTLKMRMKIKSRSQIYDMNWSRPRHGHKYTKYKMCLSKIIFTCMKQHISNIWSLIHEKVQQHWDWVEKKRCL